MDHDDKIRQLEQRLAEMDEHIAELERRLPNAPTQERGALDRELSAIRERHRHAEQRLAQEKLEQAESWQEEDLETGILEIFDDIGRRIDAMFSRIA